MLLLLERLRAPPGAPAFCVAGEDCLPSLFLSCFLSPSGCSLFRERHRGREGERERERAREREERREKRRERGESEREREGGRERERERETDISGHLQLQRV